jgi:hypothetical protein
MTWSGLSRVAISAPVALAISAAACGDSTKAGSSSSAGGTAIVCGKDLELCSSLCVDLKSDGKNCGSCGYACDKGTACVAGKCSFDCPGGLTICGTNCVDTYHDPAHCGGCDKPCMPPLGGEPLCLTGKCGFRCIAGVDDCNGKAEDGCETTLATAVLSCGKCGAKCPPVANGEAGCKDSICGVGKCTTGFEDCDKDTKNGCEAEVATDNKNCGTCGKACGATENCYNGKCEPGLLIQVEGHADVLVNCKKGDYSCQAKEICEKITGVQCVYQDYQCCGPAKGSWYPLDGASGGANFNFAFDYDFCPGTPNYGNICACNVSQMLKYGLAPKYQNCGYGHWFRQ